MLAGIEDNQSPPVTAESCRSMGKECRDCISSSASVVALLCPSLDAAAAQQTFFRMYRHEGCVNMSRAFVREYLSAVEPDFIEPDFIEPDFIESDEISPVVSIPTQPFHLPRPLHPLPSQQIARLLPTRELAYGSTTPLKTRYSVSA